MFSFPPTLLNILNFDCRSEVVNFKCNFSLPRSMLLIYIHIYKIFQKNRTGNNHLFKIHSCARMDIFFKSVDGIHMWTENCTINQFDVVFGSRSAEIDLPRSNAFSWRIYIYIRSRARVEFCLLNSYVKDGNSVWNINTREWVVRSYPLIPLKSTLITRVTSCWSRTPKLKFDLRSMIKKLYRFERSQFILEKNEQNYLKLTKPNDWTNIEKLLFAEEKQARDEATQENKNKRAFEELRALKLKPRFKESQQQREQSILLSSLKPQRSTKKLSVQIDKRGGAATTSTSTTTTSTGKSSLPQDYRS